MGPFSWSAEMGVEEASPLLLCMTRMYAGFWVEERKRCEELCELCRPQERKD